MKLYIYLFLIFITKNPIYADFYPTFPYKKYTIVLDQIYFNSIKAVFVKKKTALIDEETYPKQTVLIEKIP